MHVALHRCLSEALAGLGASLCGSAWRLLRAAEAVQIQHEAVAGACVCMRLCRECHHVYRTNHHLKCIFLMRDAKTAKCGVLLYICTLHVYAGS